MCVGKRRGGAGDGQRSVAVEICELSAESGPIIVMGILHAPLADKRYCQHWLLGFH